MKSYTSSMTAIRDYLVWLKTTGKLNYTQLEREQAAKGVPSDKIISREMLQQYVRGKIKSFTADRAEAFCKAMGIKVILLNEEIPDGFTGDPSILFSDKN